jgi:Co/Zn/Cd efflux system component
MDHPIVDEIRQAVEIDDATADTRVTDLHVWRVGKTVYSCALTIVTHNPALNAAEARRRLSIHEEIVHSTIEIHYCAEGERSEDPATA